MVSNVKGLNESISSEKRPFAALLWISSPNKKYPIILSIYFMRRAKLSMASCRVYSGSTLPGYQNTPSNEAEDKLSDDRVRNHEHIVPRLL